MSKLFTSESVTMGHPDKVADQISDAILDAMLEQDTDSRVAVETMVSTGMVVVSGEVTTKAYVDISKVVRDTIKEIGYTDPNIGFDYENCAVLISIDEQSPDISQGVSEGEGLHEEQGAGDQGMMFGYACSDTDVLMPLPIYLAHSLTAKLAKSRVSGDADWLRPDGKSQVTVEYNNTGRPSRIHTVVISTQHIENCDYDNLRQWIIDNVIMPVLPPNLVDDNLIIHVNPTGKFVTGGPKGDCGLTGRKIIVDTYGGMGRHGGGAFSGKDPSKVDRSASYMARYVAKNIVAAGIARRCEVQLSYAIGVADPLSISIDTFNTGSISEDKIEEVIRKVFPLTPKGLIEHLDLKRPIYKLTARNGHFGFENETFTWEKTDMVDKIKEYIND